MDRIYYPLNYRECNAQFIYALLIRGLSVSFFAFAFLVHPIWIGWKEQNELNGEKGTTLN